MDKELIICAATGYNFKQVEPFLKSLYKTNYTGDVVLLVNNYSLLKDLKSNNYHNVKLEIVQKFLNFIPKNLQKYRFSRKFSFITKCFPQVLNLLPTLLNNFFTITFNQFFHHIALSRYAYFHKIIKSNPKYNKIFFSDVRDVIFQDNPFNFLWDNNLYFALEDDSATLEANNRMWLEDLYTSKIFNKIGTKNVICSGTTFGNREELITYCLEMCKEQLKFIYKIAYFDGYDQGIHNYLIYSNKFKNYTLFKNFESPILSMHNISKNKLSLNKEGLFINKDGSVVNVLHQYDRFTEIAEHLLNKI